MIALIIIFSILLVLFLISLIKINATFTYLEDGVTLELSLLFFKFTIFSPYKEKKKKTKKKKTKKKQETKESSEEEKKNKKKKESITKRISQYKGIPGFMSLVTEILEKLTKYTGVMLKHIIFTKLDVKIDVVGSDSAQTAQIYGTLCSTVYPFLSILGKVVTIKDYNVDLLPSFTAEKSTIYVESLIYIRILFVVAYLFKLLFYAAYLYLRELIIRRKNHE